MEAWMQQLTYRLHDAFGPRLRFVGLQGSRARGEAGPESDIDAVVILDAVSLADLRAYRALLAGMPEREKVCGFFWRTGRAGALGQGRPVSVHPRYHSLPWRPLGADAASGPRGGPPRGAEGRMRHLSRLHARPAL